MKKLFLLSLVVFFFGLFTVNSIAQEEKKNETKTVTTKDDGKPFNTICPVSHEEIDSAEFTYEYEGKTYAVCCNSCMKKFKKDPEKYIKKLSDDGKTLKKDKK